MKIAVVYSLPSKRILSTEFGETDEDSAVIAKAVCLGLEARGMSVALYPVGEDEISLIKKIQADCVFNLIEWTGQDNDLSKEAFRYFRELGIPVTGSDQRMFELTGDKIWMKEQLQKSGISTPQGTRFITGEEKIMGALHYPVIVKPSLEHCSTGLTQESIANNADELRKIVKKQIQRFNQPALAEEFVVDREFLVYLLQDKEEVKVLPIEEVVFDDKHLLHFQTYDTKWRTDSEDYNSTDVVLAQLTSQEKEVIESECVKAFKMMGLRGYARIDLRFRDNVPYILEINANPSVYDAAEELVDVESEVIWGIKFPDYLKAIVDSAIWHFELGRRV